jgi:hypothetical protein
MLQRRREGMGVDADPKGEIDRDQLRARIQACNPQGEWQQQSAREKSCTPEVRTLKQDGIEKCLLGLTDIHEVRAAAS